MRVFFKFFFKWNVNHKGFIYLYIYRSDWDKTNMTLGTARALWMKSEAIKDKVETIHIIMAMKDKLGPLAFAE